jgi:CHAT domain-containing protein/tetratricopeptide (TPR) repeat protein
MIQERQTTLDDSDDDQAALAPCELLDGYWTVLEDASGSSPEQSQIDHLSAGGSFHTDLGALRLLHQVRASDRDGRLSQAGTVRLEHPAGWPSAAAQPRNDQQLPKLEETRRIGRYVVIEQLDSGGQGDVFRVLHPELDKQYVLKLARRPTKESPDASGAEGSSLRREGKLLAQCDHPNLVRVIDLDMHNGRALVVMEHVPGLSLEQYVLQHRPGARQAALIVAKLARAVSYLHSRGIIHQDIKPKNVLIDTQGEPRLIDLGLARQDDAWTGEADKTTGGTAVYMSPEQAMGLVDRIGPATDLFGLGGLLYFLLCRRPLYQGASSASVRWQAMRVQYVPIRQLNPRVPRRLERLCSRALAREPECRPRSAQEMERALRRALLGHRLAWVGLAVLMLALGATAMALMRTPRSALRAAALAAPLPISIDPLAVEHHVFLDGSWQWSMPIGLSPRPVIEGDEAAVSARLSAPGYGYLVALNPDGKVQLCRPSEPTEPPGQSLEIRFEESVYFPFTDGPGVQVFLAVAARRPLPAFEKWHGSGWLKEHWKHIVDDQMLGIWRLDGRQATPGSRIDRGPMRKHPGPPPLLDEICKHLLSLPGIDALQAIAFRVQAKQPAETAKPPWQRQLTGDDSRRALAQEKTIAELQKQGRFAEAAAPAQEVRTIRTHVQGDDHWETHNAQITEQALTRLAALPQAERSTMASALRQREEAETLSRQGRYAEAEPLLRGAADVYGKFLGSDNPLTTSCASDRANMLYALGRYAEAEALLRLILKQRRETLGEHHPDTAQSFNDLGMNLDALGRPEEAEPLLRTALEQWRSTLGEDHVNTAIGYGNLAVLRCGQGRYAEAEPLLRSSLLICLRTLGPENPDTAHGYNDLAGCLNHQGRYAEAEALLRTAVADRRRMLGEEHPETAQSYNSLAGCLKDQGKQVEAESLLQKALAIFQHAVGENHLDTAQSYTNLASIQSVRGEPGRAEPLYRRALSICRQTLGENEVHTAQSYGNLAVCLDELGRHDDAESLLRTRLKNCRKALGEYHQQTAAGYGELARCLSEQGKYGEAQSVALAAVRSYAGARLAISQSGLGRAEFASRRSPLPLAAALLARDGRSVEAWTCWESDLARGLFDDLEARRQRPLTPLERRRQEELVGQLGRLDNQISSIGAAASLTSEQSSRLERLKREQLDCQSNLDHFEADLAARYPTAAGAALDLKRIQALLPADTALLGWLDLKQLPGAADPRGDHWACLVRHSGLPHWVRIVGKATDQTWTTVDDERPRQVRRVLSTPGASDWQTPLTELAQQRLGPLKAELGPGDGLPVVKHLIILPSPALAGIPVEAMLAVRPESSPHRVVSYAPSGTVFAWLEEHRLERKPGAERPRHLLALGDPTPPRSEPQQPSPTSPAAEKKIAALIRSLRGATFEPLPGARREVEAVSALFDQSTILLGSEASEQALEPLNEQGRLAQYQVIHLATHGQVDDLTPLHSRLLLAQDGLRDASRLAESDGPAFDGFLTAGEVMSRWKLAADLVTLSCCQSGLGRQSGGEGLIGFAQAFFLAGSRSLLVSLWEVDDRATALLMTRFYQNWLGKRAGLSQPLPKAEALREAKEWLRSLTGEDFQREIIQISRGELRTRNASPASGHPFAHPHEWAGFILVGNPD